MRYLSNLWKSSKNLKVISRFITSVGSSRLVELQLTRSLPVERLYPEGFVREERVGKLPKAERTLEPQFAKNGEEAMEVGRDRRVVVGGIVVVLRGELFPLFEDPASGAAPSLQNVI